MRESTVRARVQPDRLVPFLALLGLLAPAGLIAEGVLAGTANAWRTLVVHTSFLVGLIQGGAAFGAALTWFRTGGPPLRRAAQCIALLLVPATLLQVALLVAVRTLAPTAIGSPVEPIADLIGAYALCAIGSAFALAAMSRDTASAIDRGLIDGRLARMLAASWPEGAPRTRVLAGAYVSVFFVAAPALAHGTLGRLGAIAHPGLLGPYVALASIVAGTGASVLIATLARDRLADVDELSPASTRVAGNVIAILSALLGAVLFSQLIAGPGPFASLDLGLLPFASRWPAWRGFAMLGLMIGDLAPAVMLATRDARSTPSTVMAAGALAGFGVWAERFALAATARAPGFSWIEVLPGIGFGAWTLLGALVVLRSVGELDDDPSVRESVPAAVR